jgi:hypothetical protein
MLRRLAKHVRPVAQRHSDMLRLSAKHGTPGVAAKRAEIAIDHARMNDNLSRCQT